MIFFRLRTKIFKSDTKRISCGRAAPHTTRPCPVLKTSAFLIYFPYYHNGMYVYVCMYVYLCMYLSIISIIIHRYIFARVVVHDDSIHEEVRYDLCNLLLVIFFWRIQRFRWMYLKRKCKHIDNTLTMIVWIIFSPITCNIQWNMCVRH